MPEKLIPRAITPMTQSLKASCVPASISMVFSGFGIDVGEQTLIDKYFPTANLPVHDIKRGVSNTDTVKGMVQIIDDLGLGDKLQVDVFVPGLCEYTRSPERRYVVEVKPRALRKYGKIFEEGASDTIEFVQTLEQLLKKNRIGVYTVNARMMNFPKKIGTLLISEEATRGFYEELEDFIKIGHIVGPHGGLTAHTRALDGTRTEKISWKKNEEGFLILDPRGESYPAPLHTLVWVDSWGAHGDTFDYLFRISPRGTTINPQQFGFRKFLKNLRNLIP